MSDTKLDPGTLRALIAEARGEQARSLSTYSASLWRHREDWLRSKLDALPSETQVAIQPETDFTAPAIPPDLAEALDGWVHCYGARSHGCDHVMALAAAIDAARGRGEL
jgi:hypothetical protein